MRDTILGDPVSRDVEITPSRVYPGEEHLFTITFDPEGPMDGQVLALTVSPMSSQLGGNNWPGPAANANVVVIGGSATAAATIDGNILTVTLVKSRKVTITYIATVASYSPHNGGSECFQCADWRSCWHHCCCNNDYRWYNWRSGRVWKDGTLACRR